MGTNYYRIPTQLELENAKFQLEHDIISMDLDVENINNGFGVNSSDYDINTPWDTFIKDIKIHIGKRSGGWKFVWNFNDNKYYSNSKELFAFIRSGRIIDEYGNLLNNSEFISMAVTWNQPDGLVYNEKYCIEHNQYGYTSHYCREVEGLVISPSTDFS